MEKGSRMNTKILPRLELGKVGRAAKYFVIYTVETKFDRVLYVQPEVLFEEFRKGGAKKLRRLLSKDIYADGFGIVVVEGATIEWRSEKHREDCISEQRTIPGDDGYESRWDQVVAYTEWVTETDSPPHIGFVRTGKTRLLDGARRCMALLEAGCRRCKVNVIVPLTKFGGN